MHFNINTIEWNRIDEDRWIRAWITTIIISVFAFILLRNIKIPERAEKVIPPEIIEFAPEIKKKIIEKKVEKVEVQPKTEKVEEQNPEVTLELFKIAPQKIPQLSEDLPISTEFRKFAKENPALERSPALTHLTKGYMYEPSEMETMNIIEGLQSVEDDENVGVLTINPNPSRDKGIYESEGISTRIVAPTEELSNDFAGFTGQINWEDWIDPLLEWIKNHQSAIYEVARLQMNVRKNDHTAKIIIKINNQRYELLLASKPEKRQLTMCLINLDDNSYTMLIDQGLKKSSNYFNIGTVEKQGAEVVDFTGTTKSASHPKAKDFTKIFWQWANTVTKKG